MDLIDKEKDLVWICKYQVSALVFSRGEEQIKMGASNILTIEKLDDFEYNLRSAIKLRVRVDIRQKLWILKNKRDIVVKFGLDKIGIDREIEEYNIGPEEVWNSEFGLYLNDEDEALDTKSLEESITYSNGEEFRLDDIQDQNYFESDNIVELYLFNIKLLNASNKTFNKVFTKGTLQHFVGELLTETKHRKVLMSPFENDDIYQEVLVPSNPAYKGLIYLDEYYGFYRYGAMIYYDLDKLYIINPNGKVTAKEKDEWPETVFLISSVVKSTPGNGMVRKPDEKVYYINVPEDAISPQQPSISKNAEYGSEAKIVITDDITIEVAEADQSYMNQRNEFLQYTRKDDNKYSLDISRARMEENECIIYISGENLDISAFTLNKAYRLIFEETSKQERYGKYKYRIAYAYHYIRVESGSYMTSSHHIALKKCSES